MHDLSPLQHFHEYSDAKRCLKHPETIDLGLTSVLPEVGSSPQPRSCYTCKGGGQHISYVVGRTSRSFREKHWALGKAQMFGQISARVGKVLQVPLYSCTTVKHGNVRQASRHPVGSPDSCAVCGRPARTRLGRQPSSRRVLSFKFRWMVRLWMCLTPLIPNTLEEPLWTKRQWQRE